MVRHRVQDGAPQVKGMHPATRNLAPLELASQLSGTRTHRPPVAAGNEVPRAWQVIISGNCSECGEQFTVPASTTHTAGIPRYCAECPSKKNKWISRERRMSLYLRDKYECQICGLPV